MNDVMKPCPFCAGDGVYCFNLDRPEYPMHWILCRRCHASPGDKRTKEEALAVWNDRQSFQAAVQPWLLACFGGIIAGDREERNHRFLEEALELVQACGCTPSEAHQLVDYVFGRPIGEARQEAGGVMVTLAALCLANALDMHEAGWTELQRIWTKVEQIRAKQAAKPKHSPLPEGRADNRATLIAALERMVTDEADDPCSFDHHGYCQAHFLEEECSMAHARIVLRDVGAGGETP